MGKFEKFIFRKRKSSGIATVTITKNSAINFNSDTMLKYIKDYEYALLYYNKEDRLIGIRLLKELEPEAYKIRKTRNNRLGSITGIAFLKYYQIAHVDTIVYPVEWDDKEQMLVIDLKKGNAILS